MTPSTLEQLLYRLPAYVMYDDGNRYFLHLQPWADRKGWNAFYAVIMDDGGIHPTLFAEGANPKEALVNLNSALSVQHFTFAADPNGFQEA